MNQRGTESQWFLLLIPQKEHTHTETYVPTKAEKGHLQPNLFFEQIEAQRDIDLLYQ